MSKCQSASSSDEVGGVGLAEVLQKAKEIAASGKLGMRFIVRRPDGNFWYVQIRVMVDGKRHFMSGKSFYDKNYGSYEDSFRAALAFRDAEADSFFAEVGYDPSRLDRPGKEPRTPKFTKRKEAKSGPLSNIHYIHLYKRGGKYTRCVVEVTVNVRGKKYHSTAYSYAFSKFGGKEQTLRIAKQDRNKLAKLVHFKAMELNEDQSRSEKEIRDIIKGLKINRTPAFTDRDPDKFVSRSTTDDYWVVAVRKKIWGIYYRAGNQRFYDSDYSSLRKSHIAARRFADAMETAIILEFKRLRESRIKNEAAVKERFLTVVSQVLESFSEPAG